MKENDEVALVKVQDLTNLTNQLKEMQEKLFQLVDVMKPKAISIKKAAEMLGVSYNSIYRMVDKGKLQSQRMNGETGKQMILLTSIEEFLTIKKD